MASTSEFLHQLKDLQLFDTACPIDDPNKKSDFSRVTPLSEVDHAALSTSNISAVEDQIDRSKAHWSTLVDHSGDIVEEEVDFKVSNEQEFWALQMHPTWGSFFANFTGDGISTGFGYVLGELVVGKKFAEDSQTELYEAQIKWNNSSDAKIDKEGREYVLKVFKKGTLLKHVKSEIPHGVFEEHVKSKGNIMSPIPKMLPQHAFKVYEGTLLKSGRFAFLMQKHHCDLRIMIERSMTFKSGEDCGPFSKEEVELLMYQVAMGVEWLHSWSIVHRDLKASNVLVKECESSWPRWTCYVANYECSLGVVGTNFFRAPEILQVCKEQKANERPEVFSKAADVYSYGMVCYEILTGKLPFEDHPLSDSPSLLIDLVINQHLRPQVPAYVENWAHVLLDGCWQFDPTKRPRIEEILDVLSGDL